MDIAPSTFDSLISWSGYQVTNSSNMYNLLLRVYEMMEHDQQKRLISEIKILMGMKFWKSFTWYVYQKTPEHPILK